MRALKVCFVLLSVQTFCFATGLPTAAETPVAPDSATRAPVSTSPQALSPTPTATASPQDDQGSGQTSNDKTPEPGIAPSPSPTLSPSPTPSPSPVTPTPPSVEGTGQSASAPEASSPVKSNEGANSAESPHTFSQKSWYVLLGFGLAFPHYTGSDGALIDTVDNSPGVSRISIGLDLPGIYFPTGGSTAVGFALNMIGDRFYDSYDYFQVNQYLLGLSAIHFPTGEFGDGFFLRGDIGPAWHNVQIDLTGSGSGGKASETSSMGLGFLFGGGYAVPISPGARLLLGGYWTYRDAGGSAISTFLINAGFMF